MGGKERHYLWIERTSLLEYWSSTIYTTKCFFVKINSTFMTFTDIILGNLSASSNVLIKSVLGFKRWNIKVKEYGCQQRQKLIFKLVKVVSNLLICFHQHRVPFDLSSQKWLNNFFFLSMHTNLTLFIVSQTYCSIPLTLDCIDKLKSLGN